SSSTSSLSSAAVGEPLEPPLATVSYQDEQKPKPAPATVVTSQPARAHFTSSHHHYHLPHQFQHPHHQNHHTHSVRVPTPTVPSSYAPPPSSSEGGSSPGDQRRRLMTPASVSGAGTGLLAATSASSAGPDLAVAVSPGRVSARSGSQHHVTIDESSLPHKSSIQETPGPSGLIVGTGEGDGDRDIGRGGGGGGDSSDPPSSPGGSSSQPGGGGGLGSQREEGQLALMYHSHQLTNYPVLPAIKRTHRPSFVYPPMPRVKA
ncbi:hypothetical protein KR059_007727, partial [Drosophila kikkawai]